MGPCSKFLTAGLALIWPHVASAAAIPDASLTPRSQGCQNSAADRSCWGDYSINTNYYDTNPSTGVVREYWWSVENTTVYPDGYATQALAINGSVPGPAIVADWGDDVVVHVTNNMSENGTSIHFHGIRQMNNNEMDGVAGVTQCPIAPGQTYTYRWRAEQYGTSWYHSHFSLQYSLGVQGPILINGPATANYDEDLGHVIMQDWSHTSPYAMWWYTRLPSGPPALSNALINGKNVFDCDPKTDTRCVGNGTRSEWVFEPGKKYRMRLVNTALYANYRFSIDNHDLTVIANDFVPIVPYKTDNVLMSVGQRYDVIVEANATPGDYWLRMHWQQYCCPNDYGNNTLGIVRYNANSTATPTSTSRITSLPDSCADEPAASLRPYVPLDAEPPNKVVTFNLGDDPTLPLPKGFMWTMNNTYMWVNWSAPTTMMVAKNDYNFPAEAIVTPDNTSIETSANEAAWVYYVFNDISDRNRSHPMHLHGHDFYLLDIGYGNFSGDVSKLNLKNPVRRDTATWPEHGYAVYAFKTDNPGAWLFHCHIAWHSSQGLGLQFLEQAHNLTSSAQPKDIIQQQQETCTNWQSYFNHEEYEQEDAGI